MGQSLTPTPLAGLAASRRVMQIHVDRPHRSMGIPGACTEPRTQDKATYPASAKDLATGHQKREHAAGAGRHRDNRQWLRDGISAWGPLGKEEPGGQAPTPPVSVPERL